MGVIFICRMQTVNNEFTINLNGPRKQVEVGKSKTTQPIQNTEAIEAKNKLKNIYGVCIKLLKTISTKLMDNEIDYFTEYDNYTELIAPLSELGIINNEIPVGEDTFYDNPPSCFVDLVIIVLYIIKFLPVNKEMTLDDVTMDNEDKTVAGHLLTIYLSFESMNFDKHAVSVFIPTQEGLSTLLCIDNIPVLGQ